MNTVYQFSDFGQVAAHAHVFADAKKHQRVTTVETRPRRPATDDRSIVFAAPESHSAWKHDLQRSDDRLFVSDFSRSAAQLHILYMRRTRTCGHTQETTREPDSDHRALVFELPSSCGAREHELEINLSKHWNGKRVRSGQYH